MRRNTEGKGFFGGAVMAVLTVGLMLLLTGTLLSVSRDGIMEPYVLGLLLFCAFVYAAIAVGVVVALVQRWREIQGGEEDEAKKY